jgi:hypothetical protein
MRGSQAATHSSHRQSTGHRATAYTTPSGRSVSIALPAARRPSRLKARFALLAALRARELAFVVPCSRSVSLLREGIARSPPLITSPLH